MPPKPSTSEQQNRPPAKKNVAKGKTHGYEFDPPPPNAGEGIFTHRATLAKYEGQWQRFGGKMKRHGTGIYTDGGATYDGEFVEDQYQGYGVYTAIDGSVYKGEWKSGKMHGHGIYTWPDGSFFEGEWENGKMEGPGTYTDKDKNVWKGTWHEGEAELKNLPIS
ncbi:MORN repeat protein [Histomonas meleagridis]|uniref:MORN repeat protein n=1 Tax=Histomonas meleagridis TaxID=135588 RepID=UPI00355A9842|nr:MORN repeat protein [Histomonas meleagridis]KAH0805529.1 MORN repeat protein [Histomonas meleagridis]